MSSACREGSATLYNSTSTQAKLSISFSFKWWSFCDFSFSVSRRLGIRDPMYINHQCEDLIPHLLPRVCWPQTPIQVPMWGHVWGHHPPFTDFCRASAHRRKHLEEHRPTESPHGGSRVPRCTQSEFEFCYLWRHYDHTEMDVKK